MGHSACAKTHFDVLGDFAFSFFKNYTVKCLDSEYSDSQGHSKSVVLKLFQDEAHLCKVNYFVAPQKKTHDENILLQ